MMYHSSEGQERLEDVLRHPEGTHTLLAEGMLHNLILLLIMHNNTFGNMQLKTIMIDSCCRYDLGVLKRESRRECDFFMQNGTKQNHNQPKIALIGRK